MADETGRGAFERAFVALSYSLARRGDELLAPLPAPGAEARSLVTALGAPERQSRAVVLARELARVAQAIDARRVA